MLLKLMKSIGSSSRESSSSCSTNKLQKKGEWKEFAKKFSNLCIFITTYTITAMIFHPSSPPPWFTLFAKLYGDDVRGLWNKEIWVDT